MGLDGVIAFQLIFIAATNCSTIALTTRRRLPRRSISMLIDPASKPTIHPDSTRNLFLNQILFFFYLFAFFFFSFPFCLLLKAGTELWCRFTSAIIRLSCFQSILNTFGGITGSLLRSLANRINGKSFSDFDRVRSTWTRLAPSRDNPIESLFRPASMRRSLTRRITAMKQQQLRCSSLINQDINREIRADGSMTSIAVWQYSMNK